MTVRLMKNEEFKLNDSEKLILYYRKFPVQAAKDLLGVDLAWFQRQTLKSMWFKRYSLLIMGRGTGKTYLMGLFACLHAMLVPGSRIGVITPSFKQTEFLFDKIEEFYMNSPFFRASIRGKVQRTTYRAIAKLRNGSFIEGLPLGTGQKIRGQRYNIVIVDEYAQVAEEIIKLVVRPMMTVKFPGIENKYIIASSAFYTWNHLYLQYILYNIMSQEEPHNYAVHEHNKDDVFLIPEKNRPFDMDADIIEMMRMDSTEEEFSMEVLGKFPIENMGFISQQLIDSCTPKNSISSKESPIEALGDNSEYTMGVDAARVQGGDNFVITILKIDKANDNLKRLVYCLALNGVKYQEMIFAIRNTLMKFPVVRINMDAGGGGLTLKDLLAENYDNGAGVRGLPILDMEDKETENIVGIRMLTMINFTRPTVNDMYMRLKADMQHKKIALPITVLRHGDKELDQISLDCVETKKELLLLQAEGKGNYYQFDVPPQFKKDRATAIALSNMAANAYLEDYQEIPKQEPASGFWV